MPLIKDLYNVKSFKAFADGSRLETRDAAYGGTVLSQQLKYISPNLFERKFPSLALMNTGISVNNEGGYAATVTSLRVAPQGSYTESMNKSANKGKISINVEDSTIKVYKYAAESAWSKDEVEESALANINLPNRFIAAHNEIYMRSLDQIGLVGVPAIEGSGPATGLLNYAHFTSAAAAGVAITSTPQQNYDELANLISTQHSAVLNIPEFKASVVLMPTAAYNKIEAQPFNSTMGDGKTVLMVLKQNFPGVTFSPCVRCDDVGGTTVTIAFSVDQNSMTLRIPGPLSFAPIEQHGFTFQTESAFRYAGLDVLEDKAGRIITGW